MIDVDLTGSGRYPPLETLPADEVFNLGLKIARAMPHLRVRAPAGDAPEDVVTLDGKLLSKKGVEVF